MSRTFRNSIVILLIVSLTTGGLVFFSAPKKADADIAKCVSGLFGTIGALYSVLVADPASDTANVGTLVNDCVLKPIAMMFARALVQKFTQDTVNWINGGFSGSPKYVTNPEGFLRNIGDQTLGQYVNEYLGDIGQVVCSPFDIQLRIALGLRYSSVYTDYVGCRLSDIQKNVYTAFTKGFSTGGGWQDWVNITTVPQNNIYGTYLAAIEKVDIAIVGKKTIELKQLDWAKGFLGITKCDLMETPNAAYNRVGDYGHEAPMPKPQCLKSHIVTPGSVIESSLSESINMPLKQLGIADSLDAIFGALVNQMISKVFTATGIFAGGSSSSQPLTVNDLVRTTQYFTLQLPAGITITGSTNDYCEAFLSKNIYYKDQKGQIIVRYWLAPANAAAANTPPTYSEPTVLVKSGNIAWTQQDYNDVQTYCQRQLVQGVTDPNFNAATLGITNGIGNGQTFGIGRSNLAVNQFATQSSNYTYGSYVEDTSPFIASRAVDGNADQQVSGWYSATQATALADRDAGGNLWWEVKLAKESVIDEVKIYKATDRTYAEAIGDFRVVVRSDKNPSDTVVWTSSPQNTGPSSGSYVSVPIQSGGQPVTGQYVRIVPYSNTQQYLELAEVQVFGTEKTTAAGANSNAATNEPFRLSLNPGTNVNTPLLKSCNGGWNCRYNTATPAPISFGFTVNKQKGGIKILATFQKHWVGNAAEVFGDANFSEALSYLKMELVNKKGGVSVKQTSQIVDDLEVKQITVKEGYTLDQNDLPLITYSVTASGNAASSNGPSGYTYRIITTFYDTVTNQTITEQISPISITN